MPVAIHVLPLSADTALTPFPPTATNRPFAAVTAFKLELSATDLSVHVTASSEIAAGNQGNCVGIGILTDHVKNIYPKSVSITKVNDLSGAIFTQLSNLLTGGKVVF